MSSDTLFNLICFARLPKTNSIASMTLLFPLPFGPTTAEKHCRAEIDTDCQEPYMETKLLAYTMRVVARAHTLWNGPICCCPAYDLKFSSTIFLMNSRGLHRPSSAGGSTSRPMTHNLALSHSHFTHTMRCFKDSILRKSSWHIKLLAL
jgi:hypothetical protein